MASRNKMLTRDIKRRVKVIESKIEDLQKMGVPCVFAYATSWTGGLYVCSDDRMTKCLKSSSSGIFKSLKEEKPTTSDMDPAGKLCLPRLPAKLSSLNSKTITSMLVGLGKDLQINWTGSIPSWWPDLVPFQHPRDAVPNDYKGTWSIVLAILLPILYM